MKYINSILLVIRTVCICIMMYICFDALEGINNRLDRANVEYQFVVEDRDIIVYDRNRYVGRVRMGKQLDSLITEDNQ
jgi:hypothetical protein